MKVLIVGASSFIGFRLYAYLRSNTCLKLQGTYFKNKLDRNFKYLDITNIHNIETIIREFEPEVIVWVAGSKNLKLCESDLYYAKKINHYPIKDYLELNKKSKFNAHLIFISTDYIFDGLVGLYKDTDIPAPNTNYGLTNYSAEKEIIKNDTDYTILRTSAVMAKGGAFFDWVTTELTRNIEIELLDNIYFSPTPLKFLLEYILHFVENRKIGVFNICGDQRLSRYEFVKILKNMNKDFKADLVPVKSISSMPQMQSDLSMVPSNVPSLETNKNLIEYLAEELSDD